MAEVKIVEGLEARHVDDALRVVHDAFAEKFRIGFRDADDLRRLFRDSVDTTSCLSALVDGQFAGLLTIRTDGQEFYHLNVGALFTRFSPLRALRMLLNLLLLTEGSKADEFVVDSLAVDPAYRGRGVGTALLRRPRSGPEQWANARCRWASSARTRRHQAVRAGGLPAHAHLGRLPGAAGNGIGRGASDGEAGRRYGAVRAGGLK